MAPSNSSELLLAKPLPLVDKERRIIVLWSPKSACTTVYSWFSNICGFLDDVRNHDQFPHAHRTEVFRYSRRYLDSLACDTSDFSVIRIIRDPYARAVSIFRHALMWKFADKEAASMGLNFKTGISFRQFLLMLDRLDMENVNVHYRPQWHPFESTHVPDTIINISKTDLFAELNAVERERGWPLTDFAAMKWLHELESSRRQPTLPSTAPMFDVPIVRKRPTRTSPFPLYADLLTPEAKTLIQAVFEVDFAAYRDHL
ncbi:MAG TPA: sulfotransferase family 2 domain-containing protein [Rhizomicrobium sp.]|nr:sulfotransferase family 2 domain-containing protein [Rhizomicrobium sp.]